MKNLERRLKSLEAQPRADELPPCPQGMLRVGRSLFVPPAMDADKWEREARAQQRELIAGDTL